MDIVSKVLENQQRELSKYKSISVEKHLECRIDVGMLYCSDPNDLDKECLKNNQKSYIENLTRDNTQLLFNEVWKLSTERVDECIVAKLPPPTITLPRLRKIPGPRPLTKWEKFAKEKGIKKKKKEKKIYDKVLDKWVPTYGFKRAEAEKEKDWVLEVPKNVDPNEDMFKKKANLRSEKIAKNEIQRMRNIVRNKKLDIPRTGYLGPEAASSQQLITAATVAKSSTASVGKFQSKLPKEKVARGLGVKELIPGMKRKQSHISDIPEKTMNLELIKSVLNKKPKYDVEKAVALQKMENKLENEPGITKKNINKKSKGAKRKRSVKKPKGNRGERAPRKKVSIGRKRR